MMVVMVIVLMRLKHLAFALMMTIFGRRRPLVARFRVDVDSLLMMFVVIVTSVVICSGRRQT